jgi:hypothetical protein
VIAKSLSGVERRCTPVEEWPQRDQLQWQAALQPGDLLEPSGYRAGHSRFSNRAMVKGYGRWLAWLDANGLLDGRVGPGDRITRDRVRTYVTDLERENATGTVIARLIELKIMAGIMEPGVGTGRGFIGGHLRFGPGTSQLGQSAIASSTLPGCWISGSI